MLRKSLCVSILLFSTSALAATWNVDPALSKLTFSAEQSGETIEGSFPSFKSTIDFDEAAPEKGKINITVDMSKIQTTNKDAMDSLPTSDWFASKEFPQAEFTSTSIRAVGKDAAAGNSYEASGKLTIRGISKEVKLPFILKTAGTSAIAKGSLILNRKDYSIGQGQWADDKWIKYPVTIRYEIHASH